MFNCNQVISQEEAYLLGLFYADGYITGKRNNKYYTLGIDLKEEDKKFLYHIATIFEKALNKQNTVHYRANTKSYKCEIHNVELVKQIQHLGIIANKSYDTTDFIFINIPDQFKKDFLLGLWDGDGSFFITQNETRQRNGASIISNNECLLNAISVYINAQLGENFCKVSPRTEGDPYPRIKIVDNKAKQFGDWLYYEGHYPYCLDRKYQKYLNFKPIHGKAHFGFDNNKTKGILCVESNKVYTTAKECCITEFGINNPGAINCIRAVCRGERSQTRNKHFRYLTAEERDRYLEYGSI